MEQARLRVSPVTLAGQVVRLEPLSEAHVADLVAAGQDETIWRYLPYGLLTTAPAMARHVQELRQRQAQGTDLPFTVIHLASGRAIGMTRFMEIRPPHRGLEIGGTWYSVAYQRTAVNTECKWLLLQHAFERLGCIRVQLKTDARNLRSQAAIERLGAMREGTLRQHLVMPDGHVRDTVMYSILAAEWPAVRAFLQGQLAR